MIHENVIDINVVYLPIIQSWKFPDTTLIVCNKSAAIIDHMHLYRVWKNMYVT